MDELISKEVVIDTLNAVRALVWEVDIPSPTVPEYIEHHEQMQSIMRNIDILTDKIIKMPSVQSESAELPGQIWDEWCTGCKEYDQERHCCPRFNRVIRTAIDEAQPEPLTDKEQRIFLAAMGREEKVCEEVDRNYVREPYEDSLMRVCKEIRRKVKGALWT